MACVEVRVGDDAVQDGNPKQIRCDDHLVVERVGEGRVRSEIGAVGRIVLRGVDVPAENSEAGAGSSDRDASFNGRAQGRFDRSSRPEVDVPGLIAAGDEDDGGICNRLSDKWSASG